MPYFIGVNVTKKNSDNILISYVIINNKNKRKKEVYLVEIPKNSFQKKVQKRKTKTKKKRLKVNQGAGGRFFDDF